jgi:thiol:disulfide interchange protein DsbG
MRRSLFAACILAVPFVAHSQSRCAIPAKVDPAVHLPSPINVTGHPVDLTPHPALIGAEQVTTVRSSTHAANNDIQAVRDDTGAVNLASIPALAHVAGAGAHLSEIGFAHGMRTVVARNGDQFMIFEVTPDGESVVSGMVMDMTVDQLLAVGGKDATELASAHGLRTLYLRNGTHFQVFYATPDGQRVIPGVLWDAKGTDLTRAQLASVPGAIPTITIGKGADRADGHENAAQKSPLQLAAATTYGSAGNLHAPQLWMFIDPQCSFSVRAMQQLRSYVENGRVKLNVIPLTLLDHEDSGLSTRNAIRLVAAPADRMVAAWASGETPAGSSADGETKLRTNMTVADAIGLRGTPTFLWRKADGTEGRVDGIPNDIAAMIASIGSAKQ